MGMLIPIHATSAMTVSAETVTVSPGEKFAVNIAVDNNLGFAYLKVRLTYDAESFEFHSSEVTSSSGTLTVAAGKEMVSWDASTNYSENGKIGTLYFTASESVAFGENTIKIDVVECYNIDTDDVQVTASDLTVNVKIIESVSTIDSADMVLSSDITVNYYAILDKSHTDAQMRFTMNGIKTVVDGVKTEDEGVYVYAFQRLAPQCMGDNIKAELILGDTVLDVKEEYSVKTYCENILSKSAAELGISEEKYASMRILIADMLEYGANAQIYRDYKINALVNEGVSEKSKFTELTSEYEKYIDETKLEGVEMTGVGVYFDYANSLYLKFTAPDLTEDEIYVLVYNEVMKEEIKYTLSDCTLLNEETATYLLIMEPSLATGYDDLYYIDLYASNSRGRVVLQQSLEYSVASYVYSMQNRTDASGGLSTMAELARATYNYGISATAYNGIAN